MANDSAIREMDSVATRIRLQRQATSNPILLVEGPGDRRILKRLLPDVEIIPADGKNNLISAAHSLMDWGVMGVVGIIDADFDDRKDMKDLSGMIVAYDMRDLEMMLISLGVLEIVLEHQGSASKIESLGGSKALAERLVSAAHPVSALRSVNRVKKFGIAFDGVGIAKKVDPKSLSLKIDSYCRALIETSDVSLGLSELKSLIESYVDDGRGPRGKDVLEFASVALRKVAGTRKLEAVAVDSLVSQLHSSCGLSLSESEWLGNLRERLDSARGDV